VSYAHSLQIYGSGCGVFGRRRHRRRNVDPASTSAAGTVANGVSGSQPQGRGLAALPPSTATPPPNSVTLPENRRYQVPPDFEANVNLHPYTSGLGPCPHEPCHSARQGAPSHYNH
jgi:hypothetical protein